MATIDFAASIGQSVAFNAAGGDVLAIVTGTAATTVFTQEGANLRVTTAQGSVVLLNTTLADLALTSINWADGSGLTVGDGTTNNALDSLGNNENTRDASNANNQFHGQDGNDTIDSGNGNNLVFGGGGADTINLGNGDNIVYGGTGVAAPTDGIDTITVGTGGGTIFANGDNDSITFGATVSGKTLSIYGGAGNDTVADGVAVAGSTINVFGGEGIDTIVINGALGNANIYGGTGIADSADSGDALTFNTGSTNLFGNGGNDTITGGATAAGNTANVYGGAGNDTFTSGAGAGTLNVFGGNGDDNIDVSNATGAAGTVVVYGGEGIVSPTDGNDTIVGGTGAVRLFGNGGTDTLTVTTNGTFSSFVYGGDGVDTINATPGSTTAVVTLAGNGGNDIFNINLTNGTGADATLTDFATGDVINLTPNFGQALTGAASLVVARGASSTVITGAAGDTDSLILQNFLGNFTATNLVLSDASVLATNFDGAAATLTGTANNDQLIAGNGGDTLVALAGIDLLTGGTGNDTFTFTSAGFVSTDTVTGGAGTDRILGSDALTVVDADFTLATSTEQLVLGNFNGQSITVAGLAAAAGLTTIDASGLTGANTSTIVAGAFGNALTFIGGNGVDTVTTGGGNDSITGAGGNDVIVSGAGNDTVDAGANDDSITGNTGTDSLTGGAGIDTFIWTVLGADNSANGETALDVAVDISVAQGDIINVNGIAGLTEANLDAGGALNVLGAVAGANFAAALSAAFALAAMNGAGEKGTFTFGGSTYFIINAAADATFDAGADFVIKLGAGADLTGLADGNIVGA